jgi:hypothetical protein
LGVRRLMARTARKAPGRPARVGDAPSATRSLRLSDAERARLAALAELLGLSESDVLREGLDVLARRHGVP